MKVLAILGGGDWYDASVEFYAVPENTDIQKLRQEFRAYRDSQKECIFFENWLKNNKGFNRPDENMLIIDGEDCL